MSTYAIQGAIQGTNLRVSENMRVAVVGPPGVGKSWLAATADKPWINDFDGRLNSLAGKPISGKTYFDKDFMQPTAWVEFENDLAAFERMSKESLPKTFVCDSMQMMCQAAMNQILVLGANDKKICRKISAGQKIYYVAGGYDAWEAEFQAVKGAISRLFSLGNVICNFHEAPEESPGSTQENPIYTGKLTVFPVRMRKLLPLFNDKWRLSADNGNRVVYTDLKDYKFNSASTLLVDSIETPDIQAMFKKHLSRIGK
jgi:hypothetical protein